MFDHVKRDLLNLLEIVRTTATWDATLAAKPEIVPTEKAYVEHKRQCEEMMKLKLKYDLT